MFKHNSMFVVAGIQTSLPYFIKYVPEESLQKFLEVVTPKGLVSFGANLTKKNPANKFDKSKHIKGVLTLLKSYLEVPNYIDMYIDSGGYQITTGLVPRKNIEKFIEAYTEFLNNYPEKYNAAFSLDIPVLPDITTSDEMLKLNLNAYNLIDSLNPDLRDRLFFVSHFRLAELLNIWNELIFDYGIINKYKKFSIGGLVASQPAAKKLYFNLYTLGILQILKGLLDIPDPFYLHILGSATSTNIIYFTLLERHLENILGKKCYVTFDSSAVFTKVQIGRTFTYFDEEKLKCWTVDLRSSELDVKHKCGHTPRNLFKNIVTSICEECNLDVPDPFEIYDSDSGTFSENLRIFVLAAESYTLNKISDVMRKHSKDLYNLYLTDEYKFIVELEKLFVSFNNDNYSDVAKVKASSIKTSLDTISEFYSRNVDDFLKYCKNIEHVLDSEQTNDYTSKFNFFGD